MIRKLSRELVPPINQTTFLLEYVTELDVAYQSFRVFFFLVREAVIAGGLSQGAGHDRPLGLVATAAFSLVYQQQVL